MYSASYHHLSIVKTRPQSHFSDILVIILSLGLYRLWGLESDLNMMFPQKLLWWWSYRRVLWKAYRGPLNTTKLSITYSSRTISIRLSIFSIPKEKPVLSVRFN